ncbi:hypothetical protein FB476_1869 [Ornithinimicrobium humiphilum]|uniref:Uncharacterized protein n=1 Tax=Ornithinimicrobium humiphilum TaxID=125288 RepID=A0A543KPF8_9MICO|nr:hypothetical protein FB476_1869 [Ornithinimicrobium humiphilum]
MPFRRPVGRSHRPAVEAVRSGGPDRGRQTVNGRSVERIGAGRVVLPVR